MALSRALPASPYLVRGKRSLQEACVARRRWIVPSPGAAPQACDECDACVLRPLCAPERAGLEAAPAAGGGRPRVEDA